MSDNASVRVNAVSFAYRREVTVLDGLSLDVFPGRVTALLGQNGSGKTTLLKLVAGALRPDRGHVSVAGATAYVPQSMQVAFAYSVLDVVLMGRARKVAAFGVPSRADESIARTALGRVGMADFARRPFDELSGGERQLVTIARALATEANVLVLDEPMASLDLRHQQLALQWMHRLAHDDGLTVLFSTHQPQHADAVADDVALLFAPNRLVSGVASDILQPAPLAELFDVAMVREASGALVPRWRI